MLGSINPKACCAETGNTFIRALEAAEYMVGHWAKLFPRGTVELQHQVVLVTAKFFLPEPACLANLFEKRALQYYLTLAKGVACTAAEQVKGPWRTVWRKALPELDRLEEECARLPIHHRHEGHSRRPSDNRLPIEFFSGPDAEDRRDLTERIIDSTAEEIRRMRAELPSTAFQLLTNRPSHSDQLRPSDLLKSGGSHELTTTH